ncbi:ATP-binding protein [Telluribacter sp.]|jgi:ATP-dependent DNA helicase RecG|uniref:ATP-binding protein n=1 Tax=Telluribacter sp. TaxID=1978767 RepID=UPI002E0F9DF9|nr:ATP-binding protein [Telluribacter sp.]
MLTENDIKALALSGEGYNVEFKVRIPSKPRELAEEVCAFAKAAGGVLLLGVDDQNQIQGISLDNTRKSVVQQSLHEIMPHLYCPFYSVSVEGKEIGVIEVPSGLQKPYTLSGAIFVRQGPNTQKIISVEQMRDFFQQSDRIYFDEGACPAFNMKTDLDIQTFEEFRLAASLSAAISRDQIINNLRLILASGQVKNGAVLFFGKQPEQFIEKAVIRCVAFEENTKAQIIDDKFFGGPLMQQYRQTMTWLKGKLDIRYEIKGGGPRQEKWEIPEVAFKEAIINALAHRDYYDKGGRIVVEVFADRVEITNPGGLVSAIKPIEFGFKSHSRNPLIFGLFERIDMVEQVGSGIARIRQELEGEGLPAPEFKTEGLFTVIFHRKKRKLGEKLGEKLGDNQRRILSLIGADRTVTIAEMAIALQISTTSVENNIRKLKEAGFLQRKGGAKGGQWEVME